MSLTPTRRSGGLLLSRRRLATLAGAVSLFGATPVAAHDYTLAARSVPR